MLGGQSEEGVKLRAGDEPGVRGVIRGGARTHVPLIYVFLRVHLQRHAAKGICLRGS